MGNDGPEGVVDVPQMDVGVAGGGGGGWQCYVEGVGEVEEGISGIGRILSDLRAEVAVLQKRVSASENAQAASQ